MNYIYISQGANDFLCAEQLKKYLKSILPIWCPYDDMPYGADASEVIPRKIKEAGAMLLVLSDWALSSKQVSRELHLADKYGVPILPVAATDVELNEKFEYFLCDIKVKNINGFDYAPEVLDSLVADLKKYVDVLPSAAEESLPAPQPVTAEPTPEPEQPAPAQANAQPQAEENPAFTARLAGALPLLRTGEERKESDYSDIVATGDKISDYLTRCGTTNELSLVTEGSTFVRYMFACGEETTADAVKEAKALIAADPALARADVYLDEKNGSVVADVPVKERSEVLFSSFLSDESYREEKPLVPVGKDVNDNGVFADLAKNGKLLVTGGTAAERNNFLTAALLSLAVKYDPAECAVLLSDGDGSLSALGALPSLSATLTGTEPAALVRAISPLDWLAGEAESRKQLFFLASDAGHTVADIDAYNACVGDEKLKRILVVISGTDGRDSALSAMTEEKLAALGEIAKYGLALVFSAGASDERQAQNFDAVLSFAEDCLTGDGDLCFKTPSYAVRAQAPALSEEEVQSVLSFLTSCEERQTDESISAAIRLAALRNFKEYQRRSAPVQLSLADIPEPAETPVPSVEEAPDEVETMEETVESVAETSFEEVAEETEEPVAETPSEEVAEELVEPIMETPSEEVIEEAEEPVAEEPSEEVTEEAEEPVTEESSEEPAKDGQAEQEEPLDPLFSVSLEEEEQTETAEAPQEETEQVTAIEPSSVGQSEEEIPATDEPAPVCEKADEPAEPEIPGETEESGQQAEVTEEVILSETDEKAAAFVEHYAAAPTDLEVDEENGEVYEPAREECAAPVDESAEIAEDEEPAEEPTESEEPAEETTENEEGISEAPASEEESEAEELPAETEEEPVATIEESAEPTAESEQETPAKPSAEPEEELDVPEEQSAQEPSVPAEEPASPSIEEDQSEEILVSSEEDESENDETVEEAETEEEPVATEEESVEPTAESEQETPVETPAEPSVESDETQDEQEEQPAEECPIPAEEPALPSIKEEQAEQPEEEAAIPEWTYVPDEQRPPKIYLDALRLVIDRKRVGISILQQRPLMLNYSKARSIIEWMTQMGYVSKPDPLGNRTLLITMDDYRTMYS